MFHQYSQVRICVHSISTDGVFLPDGRFVELGIADAKKLQVIFEHKLLSLLKANNIISETVIAQIRSWQHSGFSAWLGPQIQPNEQDARLFISEYVSKAQVKMKRIEIQESNSPLLVRYYKDQHTFKDYKPLEFLAQLTSHIPNRWEQSVRYYGAYSARTRGKKKKLAKEQQTQPSASSLLPKPPSKKKASANWARLIKKIYEVDPLVCPKCQGEMKIIAFITKPKELNRICDNLGIPEYRAPPSLTPTQDNKLRYEPLPHAA